MSQPQQTPASQDRRLARGAETRKLILQSAISNIASLGLGNTTLDRVAEVAGVSRALVVFHFKSKNNLYKEVLEYLGKRFSDGWDEVVRSSAGTPMHKLLALIDYDILFASKHPKYVSTWHAFWGESKGNMLYHEVALPRDERYEIELEKLLVQHINEGGYDKSEMTAIRDGIGAMLFGFWVTSHLDPMPNDYSKAITSMRLFLAKAFPNQPLPPRD